MERATVRFLTVRELSAATYFRARETGCEEEGGNRPASASGFYSDLEAPSPPYWRWENSGARRYYEARVSRGLFGEWYVLRSWGGIGSSFGSEQADLVSSAAAAMTVLEAIDRRRVERGYLAVTRP